MDLWPRFSPLSAGVLIQWRAGVGLAPLLVAASASLPAPVRTPRRRVLHSSRAASCSTRRPDAGGSLRWPAAARRSSATSTSGLEAWVYPLKVLDDFRLSFPLEGYPLEIDGARGRSPHGPSPGGDRLHLLACRLHGAAARLRPGRRARPRDAARVGSPLPMTMTARSGPGSGRCGRPGSMTGNVEWDATRRAYRLTEETKRFVGVVGSPGATDVSLMPYQEEPRDAPLRFELQVSPERARAGFVPIVIAASSSGREEAQATYDRLLGSTEALYVRASRTSASSRRARSRSRPPSRASTAPSRGPRSASTRASPPTPRSAPASSPASAAPGTASGPALRGSSAATRCGRPRHDLLRRPRHDPARAVVPAPLPARGRQDAPRDLAERLLVPWFTDYPTPGTAPTPRRSM